MPKVTDLTGQRCGPWRVIDQAATERRVRFWNVEHPCGLRRVLPHAMLIDIAAGKPEPEGLCPRCTPGVNGYDPAAFPAGAVAAEALEQLSTAPITTGQPWAIPDFPEPPTVVSLTPGQSWSPAELSAAMAAEQMAAPSLAACGERLETYGKAEGIADAQALYDVVRAAATQDPRPPSRQLPGMSHLGTPCDRKLAARILEGSPDRGPAWRPYVGTAVHAALGQHLVSSASRYPRLTRWLPDIAVEAGGSRGYLDVYDQDTGTVIDFKMTGVTKLREVARGKVLPVYQGQLDLYGLGMSLAGHDIHAVAVLALPMAGELEDASWYSRVWNPENAHRLLARGWRVRGEANEGRPLSSFAIAEDSCDWCPLKRRGDCPGMGKTSTPKAPPIAWGGPAVAPPPGVGA